MPTYYVVKFDDEYYTHGFSSTIDINKFFWDVSYRISFSDCSDEEVTEIMWQGKKVKYAGWKPENLFVFKDEEGNIVYEHYYPSFVH